MNRALLKDSVGWGFVLWLIGYVLGVILFMFVPVSLIGWILTPTGIAITVWVLSKKIHAPDLRYYVYLGIAWTLIAVISDYLFLVLLLHPADGYYKLDVYLYYSLTFVLPIVVGLWKLRTGHYDSVSQ